MKRERPHRCEVLKAFSEFFCSDTQFINLSLTFLVQNFSTDISMFRPSLISVACYTLLG